ncbi:hypothetical protein BKA80DRAFT_313170 [Phyllosticta citrichinensis]
MLRVPGWAAGECIKELTRTTRLFYAAGYGAVITPSFGVADAYGGVGTVGRGKEV